MKEKLIEFETAKLAKEKGFDLPTLYGCNEKGELQEYITYESYSPGEPEVTIDDFIRKWEYQLPTQSLLQRWLREVHNLIVFVAPFKDHASDINDRLEWNYAVHGKSIGRDLKTYEEALEKGLYQGLKLLP